MDVRLDDLPVHLQMKILRIVAGLSARGMAERWGKSPGYVYRVERGEAPPKQLEIKDAIEAAGPAVVGTAAVDPLRAGVVSPPASRPARTIS